jgi:outer membrane protein
MKYLTLPLSEQTCLRGGVHTVGKSWIRSPKYMSGVTMKHLQSTIWSVMFLLLTAGVQTLSQQKNLTLDEARQIALERNLSVVQAQNNVQSAQSSVLSAYGGYLPTLSLSGGWNRSQNDRVSNVTQVVAGSAVNIAPEFSVTNNFSTGVDARYTIFDGFARGARLTQASSNAVATEYSSSRTRQAIVFQVESAYLNVLRLEQLVKVGEENLKRDRRQLERITESNKVGALSIADVYRQQSTVAQDELALITAQNNYDKSKADLTALIGLDVWDDYTFQDATISPEISPAEFTETSEKYDSVQNLSERALQARPDYFAAKEQLSAAEAGVTQGRSGYMPTVSAYGGYSLSNTELSRLSDNKNLSWGLSLSWSLFDGFRTNEQLQTASASKRNAQVALLQAERDINTEIKKAVLDLDAARKQYEVSQKGLVSAEEDRKIAEERYNLGAGTLLDLLTANAGLVNAQANKVNAVYNYITAKRNLEYVVGERAY